MGLYKDECGHPNEWNLRLVNNGRTYTYCMGCIVEGLQLDNLEVYNNPFVKLKEKKAKAVPKEDKKVEKE